MCRLRDDWGMMRSFFFTLKFFPEYGIANIISLATKTKYKGQLRQIVVKNSQTEIKAKMKTQIKSKRKTEKHKINQNANG